MLCVETVGKIRRYFHVDGKGIKRIARDLRLSRNTVRRVLRTEDPAVAYVRSRQPRPRLDPYLDLLTRLLDEDESRPRQERRRVQRLYDELRLAGYAGADDSVYRFVKRWRLTRRSQSTDVFIPLSFIAGEAYQFDWSHEHIELGGLPQIVKVAHLRLCFSRLFQVIAYPRETQEMVFDAHNRAFRFFGGVTRRGIYDNMKTAVDAILIGKARKFNRRFLQLCSHYLIEPVACTPAAGWEKGQVENQVNNVREWLFKPRPKFATLDELNAWLASQCVEIAKRRPHPAFPERTVWEVYQDERGALGPLPTAFDGYQEIDCRVSATCLVRFDRNRYSVHCGAAGRIVALRAYADRIVVFCQGDSVAEHARHFGRDKTIYDPWHYVPALLRKPGALRNGAPFVDWELPPELTRVRHCLAKQIDGDRQFVAVLNAVTQDGIEAVEAACQAALKQNTVSADAILNLITRQRDPPRPAPINLPESLALTLEPRADCARYDTLLGSL